jgi:hypothetical protein
MSVVKPSWFASVLLPQALVRAAEIAGRARAPSARWPRTGPLLRQPKCRTMREVGTQ